MRLTRNDAHNERAIVPAKRRSAVNMGKKMSFDSQFENYDLWNHMFEKNE